MKINEIELEEFKIMGFIEQNIEGKIDPISSDIEYGSWGETSGGLCPHCGQEHDIQTHNEINWEDQYPAHYHLKKNIDIVYKNIENLVVTDKKYEIIKFGDNINDDSINYNMVGVRVKDLNKTPRDFIGMRFPARNYVSIITNMNDFMNSAESEQKLFDRYDLDDYFIIEYDIGSTVKFNDLIITVYYPIKRQ